MINKNISTMFLGLLLSATNLHAESIPCPDIVLIQQGATRINIAAKFNGTYTVYTEDYVFNKDRIYWRVGAKDFIALSDENALQIGKDAVKHTDFKKQELATELDAVEYSCTYGPGNVYALGFKL